MGKLVGFSFLLCGLLVVTGCSSKDNNQESSPITDSSSEVDNFIDINSISDVLSDESTLESSESIIESSSENNSEASEEHNSSSSDDGWLPDLPL